MEKKTNQKKTQKEKSEKLTPKFKCVNIKEVDRGDVIYIENKPNAVPYLLVDKGSGGERYILIENLNTHFAYLYHFTNLYKSI